MKKKMNVHVVEYSIYFDIYIERPRKSYRESNESWPSAVNQTQLEYYKTEGISK